MLKPRTARPMARRGVPVFAVQILSFFKEVGFPIRVKPMLKFLSRRICQRRGANQRPVFHNRRLRYREIV